MANQAGAYHHGDLRAALLAKATDMVAESGVASVTMRELGRRLGVSRAAPYRHFEDKEALLVAVAAIGFEQLNARLGRVEADTSLSTDERFRRMAAEYIRFALENPAHYRLMYGREAVTRIDHPELREAGNALFEHLVEVFDVQQRQGFLKAQDARLRAYVAWAAVHGIASLIIDGQILADVDVEKLMHETAETLLEGMRSSP